LSHASCQKLFHINTGFLHELSRDCLVDPLNVPIWIFFRLEETQRI
jgi:hypothetical protein